jgi:hypothetical protein
MMWSYKKQSIIEYSEIQFYLTTLFQLPKLHSVEWVAKLVMNVEYQRI